MTSAWPSTDAAIFLWATSDFLWTIAHFALPSPLQTRVPKCYEAPLRAFALTGALLAMVWTKAAWPWLLLSFLASIALSRLRPFADKRGRRTTLELSLALGYPILSAILIGTLGLSPIYVPCTEVISTRRAAALLLSAAATLFLLRGGSIVVRAVLHKSHSLPETDTASAKDESAELERGRIIGYLERLLIAAIIVAGQYTALGFLIAAKGLIRSKELEKHSFAEYFLVGTLTSVAVAFLVGLTLHAALAVLW